MGAGALRGGAADLTGEAGALRGLGDVAGRSGPFRIGEQAAAVEIFRRFAVEFQRLLARLGDADELQESGAVRVAVLAETGHLAPETVHGFLAVLVAEIGQIRVDVVHLGAPLPCLDRAAAGDPHGRVGLLHRARPDVDVALLVIAAVEGERILLGPGAHHEVVCFQVAFAQHGGVLAIAIRRVHRRADRETSDQAPAGDHVDHGEFLRHAGRRIVEGEGVAHDADGGVLGAPRQGGGDQVGRGHQAVAVGVVLVAAHRVEAAIGGVFHFVHEVVVHQVRAFGIEQRGVDVHPDRRVFLAEIVRQFGVGHQVEPHEAHGSILELGAGLLASMAGGLVSSQRRAPLVTGIV